METNQLSQQPHQPPPPNVHTRRRTHNAHRPQHTPDSPDSLPRPIDGNDTSIGGIQDKDTPGDGPTHNARPHLTRVVRTLDTHKEVSIKEEEANRLQLVEERECPPGDKVHSAEPLELVVVRDTSPSPKPLDSIGNSNSTEPKPLDSLTNSTPKMTSRHYNPDPTVSYDQGLDTLEAPKLHRKIEDIKVIDKEEDEEGRKSKWNWPKGTVGGGETAVAKREEDEDRENLEFEGDACTCGFEQALKT